MAEIIKNGVSSYTIRFSNGSTKTRGSLEELEECLITEIEHNRLRKMENELKIQEWTYSAAMTDSHGADLEHTLHRLRRIDESIEVVQGKDTDND